MDLLDARIIYVETTRNTANVMVFTNGGATAVINGIACDASVFEQGQYVQIQRPNAATDWRIVSGSGGGSSGMWRD